MKNLADFFPRVMPFAPGCSAPIAEQYIRDAAIEFCMRTRAWRDTDEFVITAATEEIVTVPPYAALHEIERMWLDGRELTPVTWPTAWEGEDGTGTPRYVTQVGIDGVRVSPAGEGALKVSMFLKPAESADLVPDFLLDQYAQVIADGALSRILVMPGKTYTNPDMAALFGGSFQQQTSRLFNLSRRGQQRAPVRTRPRFL